MQYGCIYMIRNKINGKVYIGYTKSMKERIASHKSDLKHNKAGSIKLQNAYNKYGIDSFQWFILQDYIPIDKLSEKEIKWIKKFNSRDNGYNVTYGGENPPVNYGIKNPSGKLQDYQIIEIVNKYINTETNMTQLSIEYNVALTTISALLNGKIHGRLFNDDIYLAIENAKRHKQKTNNIEIVYRGAIYKSKTELIKKYGYKHCSKRIMENIIKNNLETKSKLTGHGKRIIIDNVCFYSRNDASKYFNISKSAMFERIKKRGMWID